MHKKITGSMLIVALASSLLTLLAGAGVVYARGWFQAAYASGDTGAGTLWILAVAFAAAAVLGLSGYMALSMTNAIVRPINAINLDAPLDSRVYDELTPLLTRLALQNAQIEKQLAEIVEKQEKFNAVVEHMEEGLLLLDSKHNVLTISKSAEHIFEVKEADIIGREIYAVDNSEAMRSLMRRSLNGRYCDAVYSLKGREYLMICNPVYERGGLRGYVLSILDVTNARETERMRREFSTNVTHELKTPLTTIAGYAEIMANGIAKKEDMHDFAGRILDESMHLREMIDGILLLSMLDNKGDALPFQELELLQIVESAANTCRLLAQRQGVELCIEGHAAHMHGIPTLLTDAAKNIIENGILYNKPNGRVDILVQDEGEHIRFSVKDTGIGIREEDQERVFERFFRADRSRTKNAGGTGLGLSIAKHCARLHGAQISLESKINEGTCITICFHKLGHEEVEEEAADMQRKVSSALFMAPIAPVASHGQQQIRLKADIL